MLSYKAKNNFTTYYNADMDAAEGLGGKLGSIEPQLIGIIRWSIDIFYIAIFLETSLLMQNQVNPFLVHLEV